MDGVSMQRALLDCEVLSEERITDLGPGHVYHLKIGDRLIPLGSDKGFADSLRFAIQRNARKFEGICVHEWSGFKHPHGGLARKCKKCGQEDREW